MSKTQVVSIEELKYLLPYLFSSNKFNIVNTLFKDFFNLFSNFFSSKQKLNKNVKI